ncbi:hypothetical protein JCM19233_98 [Vibrio astriarenae]|nr:hypothetical protein JCM19233_98 [Vibrio sp. C7]
MPSYASAANADMKNMVFFDWSRKPPHRVCVVDDENRLPSKPYS